MIKINMPIVGQDIPTGVVLEWLKKEGDSVEKEEVIAAVQSEKADFDVESPASGVLLKILKQPGEEVEVLKPIGYIGEPGEVFEEKDDGIADDVPEKNMKTGQEHVFGEEGPAVQEVGNQGKVVASPLARKVAREAGLSLQNVRGTGPNGRIIKKNVLASLHRATGEEPGDNGVESEVPPSAVPAPAFIAEDGDRREAYSRIRQIIADRMTQSVRVVPHFYLTADIPMDAAAAWRARANAQPDIKITYTDIIAHAVSVVLREFPRLNAHASSSEMLYKKRINIGIAVASDEGLLVPVVADTDQKDVVEISREIREKSAMARRGKLDLSAKGTFTISSLGMYGITSFQPIINPPETGILAVGKIQEKIVGDGRSFTMSKVMLVTLACDHRAVDGAYGAEFLDRFRSIMEKADFRMAKW